MVTDKSKDTEQTPPKETIIIIRPSFKKVCGGDACRAALFNHLLYSIACKMAGGSDYWYGTLDDIHKGLEESWSMGKMRKELDLLLEQGIIGQKHNEKKKWDRTMQYFFNQEHEKKFKGICKKLDIDLSSIGLPSQVMHLLNLTNASVNIDKSNSQKRQMEMSNMANPFVNNGRAIPEGTSKVPTKDVSKDVQPEEENRGKILTGQDTYPGNNPTDNNQPTITLKDFSSEERRIYDLFCQIETRPRVTTKTKEQCAELAPDVQSLEDMESLYKWTQERLGDVKNKHIYLGNMTPERVPWKRSRPKKLTTRPSEIDINAQLRSAQGYVTAK